ncbi:MAG: ATP-dependent Zn protease [Xenococcus sp. MO_188.B8]|nr:ATP-dependent Zn protease [Xenococcus sp. MO_188.B8]
MQQTAFNIIAIAIFVMTISSLLGPIFNISPTIPAVTTFGIMGLATIDTLSWNNKGATLFLDLFTTTEQRQRVIHHEAGHFLTAYFLGIPITDYTLTAWEAFKQGHYGQGGVVFEPEAATSQMLDKQEMRLTLDRLCTVWMAGIAAEKLVYDNTEGGSEDCQQLRIALNMAGLPTSVYGQKERWGQLQATSLLQRHQQAFEALVIAMAERKSVAECCQIIQENC